MNRIVLGIVGLAVCCAVALPGIVQAQMTYCYQCYSDGERFYCSMPHENGGTTCRQPSPYSCILEGPCGGGGGCFRAGTMVLTPNGLLPIENLEVGDEVVSRSDSGQRINVKVLETYRSISCGHYLINGDIEVTGTHPFWSNSSWKEVAELQVGDALIDEAGNPLEVIAINLVNRQSRVYNIRVSDTNTFFAGGVLVHNKPPDPFD